MIFKTPNDSHPRRRLSSYRETSQLNYELSTGQFQSLDKQALEILNALRESRRAFHNLLDKRSLETQQHIDEKVSNINKALEMSTDRVTSKLDDLVQKVLDMADLKPEKAFKNSIFDEAFKHRRESLSGPFPKTFEWIFDSKGGAEELENGTLSPPRWDSFSNWLEDPDSSKQYWLSGKAGSGKSTLMAYLVRDDLGLRRTKERLGRWSGSKPLHVLSFFLFRANSKATVEYLLRSLIYQLLECIPIMAKVLMAEFLPPGCEDRIPTWPISKLKRMLKSALQVAEDCSFFLCIDGVDELQDKDQRCSDLLAFLYDVQKPSNVKLCISSRPEAEIARECSTFLKAELANVNDEDIRTFVTTKIEELPELDCRKGIVWEICDRANGIFLWAVFAVQEVSNGYNDTPRHSTAELLRALDKMDDNLEKAILHMVQRIPSPHRQRVTFCLQAIKLWKQANPLEAPNVAVITASQAKGQLNNFAAACQREARDLRDFSRGLIEIGPTHWQKMAKSTFPKNPETNGPTQSVSYLIHTSHRLYGEDDKPHEILESRPEHDVWAVVAEDDHIQQVNRYCEMSVSVLHRSVYDLFFSPPNDPISKQTETLFNCGLEDSIHARLEDGLQKLFWATPIPIWPNLGQRRSQAKSLADRVDDVIKFTVSVGKWSSQKIDMLDQVRLDVRQELLRSFVYKPLLGRRGHIPGDIYSGTTLNGRLQMVDDERCCNHELRSPPRKLGDDEIRDLELHGPHEIAGCLAIFDSAFWSRCDRHKRLEDYAHAHLDNLHYERVGRLTLMMMVAMRHTIYDDPLYGRRPKKYWVDNITRWSSEIINTRETRESPSVLTSMWQWFTDYDTSCTDTYSGNQVPSTINYRSAYPISGVSMGKTTMWLPRFQDLSISASRMIVSLVQSHCSRLDSILFPITHVSASSVSNVPLDTIKLWDAWIALDIEAEHIQPASSAKDQRALGHRTKIFSSLTFSFDTIDLFPKVSTTELINDDNILPAQYHRSLCRIAHLARYRLSKNDAKFPTTEPQVLFFHDVFPPLEIWKTRDLVKFHALGHHLPALSTSQVDSLVQSVRRDTMLNQTQKDILIGDLELMAPGSVKASKEACACNSVQEESGS